ncbi:MAG: hypothetical protein L0229_21085 [Blastocatellia bacterium]|nr:hypothetical protein [Blastocatellia bacterium]
MKTRLILLAIAVMATLALTSSASIPWLASGQREPSDLPEREEIRQTYELAPGARVEVSGINGTVDIETHYGDTAEVHIVRSARNREDLNYKKIEIEYSPNRLVIKTERDRERHRDRANVRQRVMLKLPRHIDLATSGVNGWVKVGEVDGPVRVSGVNGSVTVDHAVGYSHLSGINGRVSMTISRLSEQGIHVSGVNGGVDLRFTDELNADLDVSGINGSVQADVPNVILQGKLNRNNFRARIGEGGPSISVSGVNGSVKLGRVGM